MNTAVKKMIAATPDCFGAPYVCDEHSSNCLTCRGRSNCAVTALLMVRAVEEGAIELEGVSSDPIGFMASIKTFLPADLSLLKQPITKSDLDALKIFHARSNHLILSRNSIDDLLDDLEEEPKAIQAVSIGTKLHQQRQLEKQKEPLPTAESACLPITAKSEVKDNVVPLFRNSSLDDQPSVVVSLPALTIKLASTSERPYAFPARMDGIDHHGVGGLGEQMARLVAEWKTHGEYMRIRDEYCCLASALNREGLKAPAFRPVPTIPKLKDRRTQANMTLHRDLLVIDCHWLRSRSENVWPRDAKYQPLFDIAVPFSFDLAALFASEVWTKLHRADEAFILTARQQCQLKTMKGTDVRDRLELAENGFGRGVVRVRPKIVAARKAMREWCSKDKRLIPHRQVYEDLWLARELLDQNTSMKDIAELGGLIAGTPPLNEKTVLDKLKRLNNWMTGGYGGMSKVVFGVCPGASKMPPRL